VNDRYQRIQAMEKQCDLTLLCQVLGVSRSGYYAWCQRKPSPRQQANTLLLEAIQHLREGQERCYGSPRMTRELQSLGLPCGENRIAKLMQEHDLRAQAPRRFVPRTTDSNHDLPIAPNRLAGRAAPDGPNQVWLQDFTYVRTAQGWLYLALVLDLWSRKIVGWAMADHMRSELVVSALQMACTQRQPAPGLMAHSDRGVQYASHETRQFLQDHGLI
jgi:putative transposase